MFNKNNLKKYQRSLDKNGFFIVKKGFSSNDILTMINRLELIIQGKVICKGRRFQEEQKNSIYGDINKLNTSYQGPNVTYRKISDLEYDSIFLQKIKKSWIREICNSLVGNTTTLMRTAMMNKSPKIGSKLPWHQDVNKKWPTLTQPKLAIWFSLDPLNPNNGPLEVIPASHKYGIIGEGHILAENLVDKYAPKNQILTMNPDVGDVLFFDAHLLHRSGVNITNNQRRAINIILMPGIVEHAISKKKYPVLFGENELLPEDVAKIEKIPSLNS